MNPPADQDLKLLRRRLAAIDGELEEIHRKKQVATRRRIKLAVEYSEIWKAIAEHSMVNECRSRAVED